MLAWEPACGWTLACSALEEFAGSGAGEGLDFVDEFAAAVVAAAGVTFGVFVGQDRAGGLLDGGACVVVLEAISSRPSFWRALVHGELSSRRRGSDCCSGDGVMTHFPGRCDVRALAGEGQPGGRSGGWNRQRRKETL